RDQARAWPLSRVMLHGTSAPVADPLSLHDALPIWRRAEQVAGHAAAPADRVGRVVAAADLPQVGLVVVRVELRRPAEAVEALPRSEEHTSELQSRENLVCRLLLEKTKLNMTGRRWA